MTTRTEADLARLGHLNHAEFARESARWSGRAGEIEERGGVLLTAASTTFPVLYNAATRLDDTVPATEVIERADAWFGARGRGWTIACRDLDGIDDDLMAAAEAAGLVALMSPPEMVCRARLADEGARPVPAGSELRWVSDAAGFADFITVTAAAYQTLGLPPEVFPEATTDLRAFIAPHVQSVVAYLDGEPVAAAQTILSHGIAGVYCVGTVEAARGTGLGEAVTRAVTNRGFDRGAAVNTLQASDMGAPIYRRMGYEELYRYRNFVRFV